MAAIQGRDTKPEMVVRKWLWGSGFRYRLNHKRLPGKPDIVLLKYRTCIFVNGCFWHAHLVKFSPNESLEFSVESFLQSGVQTLGASGQAERESVESIKLKVESSECCKIPKTNTEFWVNKIRRNKERDIEVQKQLAAMGWHCITIWECELKPKVREKTLESLVYTLNKIFLQDHSVRCKMDDVRCKMDDVRCKKDDVRGEMAYSVPEEEPMMAAETPDIKK